MHPDRSHITRAASRESQYEWPYDIRSLSSAFIIALDDYKVAHSFRKDWVGLRGDALLASIQDAMVDHAEAVVKHAAELRAMAEAEKDHLLEQAFETGLGDNQYQTRPGWDETPVDGLNALDDQDEIQQLGHVHITANLIQSMPSIYVHQSGRLGELVAISNDSCAVRWHDGGRSVELIDNVRWSISTEAMDSDYDDDDADVDTDDLDKVEVEGALMTTGQKMLMDTLGYL